MSRIWEACRGNVRLARMRGTLLRMVESQEQVATGAIVDSTAEQAVLEDILEAAKPPLRAGSERLHYLLQTPFRYPPLAHGSRFGSRFEPSIFYGSLVERTVLAEAAYYRFWFWFGMQTPPPSQQFITQHTVFRAGYDAARGLKLHEPPFDAYRQVLRSPDDYAETQALGAAMRGAGVQAFEYVSARDLEVGINIAIFSHEAFSPKRRIRGREEWTCTTTASRVWFVNIATRRAVEFELGQFLIGGLFPDPAP